MAVEVDDADGAVGAVDAPEQGKSDGVVAAEGDDAGEGFALFGGALLVGVGVWLPHEEGVVTFFDLSDGVRVVVSDCSFINPYIFNPSQHHPRPPSRAFDTSSNLPWPLKPSQIATATTPPLKSNQKKHSRRHGDIPAVQHFGPAVKRVRSKRHVVPAAEPDFA